MKTTRKPRGMNLERVAQLWEQSENPCPACGGRGLDLLLPITSKVATVPHETPTKEEATP